MMSAINNCCRLPGCLSQDEQEEEEEIEEVYVPYTPPVARPWNSLGSELEIDEETVVESRKKVGFVGNYDLFTLLSLTACKCERMFGENNKFRFRENNFDLIHAFQLNSRVSFVYLVLVVFS